jgi:hypothetical protein
MSDETAYQPQVKISWLLGVAAAFVIFVLIGAYSSRMTRDYTDYDQDRAAQRYQTLAKVRSDEQALLVPVDKQGNPTAVWVDQDKGIVHIPIDDAMAAEVVTLKSKVPVMGMVIPGTTPAPATSASTNAAPAAPATPAAKPAKPEKPAKTTFVFPGQGTAPVFKTRRIPTTVWVRDGEYIWVKGGLIKDDLPAPATPKT